MKKVYDENLVYVGERIRVLRRKRGYSQESFAEALEVSGMTISRIENGMTSMSILLLLRMAAVLEVSVEEILGGAVKTIQKC